MHAQHPVKQRDLYGTCVVAKPWACVTVRCEDNKLVIVPGSIGVLKPGAVLVPVPPYLQVVDEDDMEQITPSRGKLFYITTESFNPYHLVAERTIGGFDG